MTGGRVGKRDEKKDGGRQKMRRSKPCRSRAVAVKLHRPCEFDVSGELTVFYGVLLAVDRSMWRAARMTVV